MVVEIIGVIAGLLYLFLEIKQKNAMWLIGIILAVAYIVIFAQEKLFATMALHIYYLGVSVYGWIQWKKDADKLQSQVGESANGDASIFVNKLSWKVVAVSFLCTAILYFLLAFVLNKYTGDPNPQVDAAFTALSALGTYWLSRSYVEQWLIWIVTDVVGVFLYFSQGLYPTTILYSIYTISAIYGFYHWKKKGLVLK